MRRDGSLINTLSKPYYHSAKQSIPEMLAAIDCNGQQKQDAFLRRFPIKFSLKL